jgi:hypothetical protein
MLSQAAVLVNHCGLEAAEIQRCAFQQLQQQFLRLEGFVIPVPLWKILIPQMIEIQSLLQSAQEALGQDKGSRRNDPDPSTRRLRISGIQQPVSWRDI